MNKKITIGVIVGLIFVFGIILDSYLTSPSRAYKVLDRYLKEKYGEEFVISYMGLRSLNNQKWYEAGIVYPKSYIGTEKENDTYYWGRGFVEISGGTLDPGDSYGGVLLNESANEFYLPKLKELFGANVLPILNIKGGYDYTDFQKELKVREKVISGGIYIFGRVENDEDREWYRKQIYEFVQFMKQTGTFEYVDLDIEVIDERILTDEFQNSKKLKSQLIENRISWEKNEITAKESDEQRKKLLNTIKNINQIEIKNNIDKLNKGNMNESTFKETFYTVILYTKIYSPKYIGSNSLDEEKIKNYDNVTDIEFDMGGYY